ncbi:hypothetical protein K491DRAFT_703552 [Lophiostoma macrostomum CBS 122681]|uniref:Peroxin 11C n=1 Tax=Lophiostoma macrostomum CBS 122681 TaxID=1314788 RepID=A0A6A6TBP2_9PLEO|nr:hypothetical protein K491DRAFT_703552 [Lophiostoma macrostomum CBS 122681]
MSDEPTEPGAPTAKAADEATDKVTSKEVSKPSSALSAAKQLDHILLRLNKLLASPGGLSAFLSTFNYTLYVLAYLQSKSPSLATSSRKLLSLLKSQTSHTAFATSAPTVSLSLSAVPPLAVLAKLISQTRTTLRLFGLFPLYAWLRSLLAGPKPGTDAVLHRIALTQCLSYMTYQALENISVLADAGIVPTRAIALLNRGNPSTARVYLWAYRAWLGGVSCDFLRLAREAQIESKRRRVREQMRSEGRAVAIGQDEEDQRTDAKWWLDLMIAGAWFPMALHFSSATGGLPGWNLGWMGVCGLVAGGSRAGGLWSATGL